ncbi:hypothetical protein ACTMU2_26785 [Cupriavidus basilensis]
MMQQVDIVDRIPNGSLLYGFHPDADLRPEALKTVMESVYDYKIAALEAMTDANAENAELISAYRCEDREGAGRQVGCATMRRSARRASSRSGSAGGPRPGAWNAHRPYLRGESFSLGDVLRGVNLVRLAYLGLASMWEDRPNVVRYASALLARPSLHKEAIQATMNSMPPSRYLDAIAGTTEVASV